VERHGEMRSVVRLYLPPGEGEDEPALWRIEHADGRGGGVGWQGVRGASLHTCSRDQATRRISRSMRCERR